MKRARLSISENTGVFLFKTTTGTGDHFGVPVERFKPPTFTGTDLFCILIRLLKDHKK